MKYKYKIVHNNHQFYENDALIKFIKEEESKGYVLYNINGRFGNILKFQQVEKRISQSYILYYRHLDEQIDAEIEKRKAENLKIVCQNEWYIVFALSTEETSGQRIKGECEKQNVLLGFPIKKGSIFISICLIISFLSFFFRMLFGETNYEQLDLWKYIFYLILNSIFFVYFIGDIHDVIAGKAVRKDGILYFSERTRFKNVLFVMGDVCRLVTFVYCVTVTVLAMAYTRNMVIIIDLLKIWLFYGVAGYIAKIQFRGSYVFLLIISMLLITLGF